MSAKIIAYRPGFEANDGRIDVLPFANDSAGRDDHLRSLQRNGYEAPLRGIGFGIQSENYVRVDSVNSTELCFCADGETSWNNRFSDYREPSPSAALSLELAVELHYVGKRRHFWEPMPSHNHGEWDGIHNLLCRSHAERMRVAKKLAASPRGLFEIDSDVYEVAAMWLVDRTVVYASRRGLRRSNIGSPLDRDRRFTERLSWMKDIFPPGVYTITAKLFAVVPLDGVRMDSGDLSGAKIDWPHENEHAASPEGIVIIGAHLDSHNGGGGRVPGADDQGEQRPIGEDDIRELPFRK